VNLRPLFIVVEPQFYITPNLFALRIGIELYVDSSVGFWASWIRIHQQGKKNEEKL
jgi:hypothetical protein